MFEFQFSNSKSIFEISLGWVSKIWGAINNPKIKEKCAELILFKPNQKEERMFKCQFLTLPYHCPSEQSEPNFKLV